MGKKEKNITGKAGTALYCMSIDFTKDITKYCSKCPYDGNCWKNMRENEIKKERLKLLVKLLIELPTKDVIFAWNITRNNTYKPTCPKCKEKIIAKHIGNKNIDGDTTYWVCHNCGKIGLMDVLRK